MQIHAGPGGPSKLTRRRNPLTTNWKIPIEDKKKKPQPKKVKVLEVCRNFIIVRVVTSEEIPATS